MVKATKWEDIITKEILEKEYSSGKSWLSIADTYGCGETTVARLALKYGIKSRSRLYDLTNTKFGKLLVVGRTDSKKNNSMWLCLCDCGKQINVLGCSLKSGATRSCGCLSRESLWKGFGEISGTYWGRCKSGAKNRGIPFNLNIEDAWEKFLSQDRKCSLSGRLLVFNPQYCNPRSKEKEWQTASLDRIDSLKGYEINNIQWVHTYVNYMKCDIDQDEFIQFCKEIATYRS